ncbi:MAG: TrkA family potassium uptake protein [Candidatus Omnitrophota bacterium]|nr:TrkA family potassium uptake protein [Candidatus Omnitrophota bacterium]
MVKQKVFAVFGLGVFGTEVCRVLSEKGMKVIAVDSNPKKIERIKDSVTQAILMDSSDEDALRGASLQDVDLAVVAIGENIDTSVLTTLLLKNLGIPYIIARAISKIHAQVLRQIGATEVINIQIEQGKRLANRIIAPDVMDIIPISENQSLAEMRIPKEFINRSLRELDLRKKYNINIISVKRTETAIDEMGNPVRKEIILTPSPKDVLKVNDVLVILGEEKDLEKVKGMI